MYSFKEKVEVAQYLYHRAELAGVDIVFVTISAFTTSPPISLQGGNDTTVGDYRKLLAEMPDMLTHEVIGSLLYLKGEMAGLEFYYYFEYVPEDEL